jgi:hypothetical protein
VQLQQLMKKKRTCIVKLIIKQFNNTLIAVKHICIVYFIYINHLHFNINLIINNVCMYVVYVYNLNMKKSTCEKCLVAFSSSDS